MTDTNTTYTPRVAIVTGASRGIGQAIALRLAQDGIDVVVNDISAQKATLDEVATEIQGLGRKTLVVIGDVSLEDDVKKLIEDTVQAFGYLDIVRDVHLSPPNVI